MVSCLEADGELARETCLLCLSRQRRRLPLPQQHLLHAARWLLTSRVKSCMSNAWVIGGSKQAIYHNALLPLPAAPSVSSGARPSPWHGCKVQQGKGGVLSIERALSFAPD